MKARELDFELPSELIAQEPLAEREASRLLWLDRVSGGIRHTAVRELPALLKPSLLVVNDTRVIAARMHGKKSTGGSVELLLVEPLSVQAEGEVWLAWGRSSKSLRAGHELFIEAAPGSERARGDVSILRVVVQKRREHGELEVLLCTQLSRDALLSSYGELALPPYIERPVTAEDAERYQTVFAKHAGAIAAPTAGLHFSEKLLEQLTREGHRVARVTLHVGPGTFSPLRSEDLAEHPMHEERFEVPSETALQINEAKAAGVPVVAVGTTVVRTLESAVGVDGKITAGAAGTSLFVYPPYEFKVIDALFTNFHLPRSTLLALVMAFGGTEHVRAAYQAAVEQRYRFFSYGDAMLVSNASLLRSP